MNIKRIFHQLKNFFIRFSECSSLKHSWYLYAIICTQKQTALLKGGTRSSYSSQNGWTRELTSIFLYMIQAWWKYIALISGAYSLYDAANANLAVAYFDVFPRLRARSRASSRARVSRVKRAGIHLRRVSMTKGITILTWAVSAFTVGFRWEREEKMGQYKLGNDHIAVSHWLAVAWLPVPSKYSIVDFTSKR